MAQEIKSRAVIPTNSLMLINEAVGDSLNNCIQYIRASSTLTEPSIKTSIHKNVIKYMNTSIKLNLRFNRAKVKEPIDLDSICEAVRFADFHDLWVHDLILQLYHGRSLLNFHFKNAPLTEGSNASAYVLRYLRSLVDQGWIRLAQIRHLPLIGVTTEPEGANLQIEEISDPSFIAWLSSQTGGLVKLKTVRRVDDFNFIDLAIKEI